MVRASRVFFSGLLLLSACAGSNSGRPSKQTPASTPSPRAESSREISGEAGAVYSVVTWDHFVAWSGGDAPAGNDRVYLHDLNTKQTRVIARGGTSKAQIDHVRGHGATVVYSELAHTPSTQDYRAPWRTFAVDIATGRSRLIAKSSSSEEERVFPYPEIEGTYIVDTIASGRRRGNQILANIVSYDLNDNFRRRTLVKDANPARITVMNGQVYFDDDSKQGRDLFTVPLQVDSRAALQLTRSGKVATPTASEGTIAWEEPPQGDPDSIWALSASGGEPVRIYGPGRNPWPAKGFVVFLSDGQDVIVQPLTMPSVAHVVATGDIYIGARWSADGTRIVWASQDSAGQATPVIHVSHIAI